MNNGDVAPACSGSGRMHGPAWHLVNSAEPATDHLDRS
jgi:hypothetical protein